MTDRRAPHVVVVGGGLAGLAAALGCADSGARVTLLESRPRLGGATWSFARNGLDFDNGQHVYLRCCVAYRRFLERVGTAALAPLQDRLCLPVLSPRPGRDPKVAYLRRSALPSPLHLLPALVRYSHLSLGDRLRVGRALRALQRLRVTDADLDAESFESFLARHGQRPSAISGLFELITLPTTNVHASEASLLLATKVFRAGLLSEPDAADIGWARAPLRVVHGDAAAKALAARGATVRRRAKVRHIELTGPSAGGGPTVSGVLVEGERLDADAVVLAVAHDAAAELVPEGSGVDPDALRGLGTSPIIDVHLVFDRRVCPYEMAAGVGTPVQYIFDKTEASGLEGEAQCLSVSVSGADDEHGERPEVLIDRYRRALVALFPKAASARLLDAVVSREHAATFRGLPGTQALRPGTKTDVANLYLAGAWTDTGWPATMEGAVRSGNRAAWHVLRDLGRPPAFDLCGEEQVA